HLLEGSVSRSPPVPRPSLQPLPKAEAGRHGGAGHPLSPAWIPGHGRVQKPPVEAPGEGPAFGLLEVAGREALVEGLVAVEDPRVDRVPREPGEGAVQLPVEAGEGVRSEEHTSELQSRENLVCRLLLEKK